MFDNSYIMIAGESLPTKAAFSFGWLARLECM